MLFHINQSAARIVAAMLNQGRKPT